MSGSQQYLMASMTSQGSSENGSTEYYHELIQNVARDTLVLDEGENWLRLVVTSSGTRHVLEDTQDTILAGTPYPSIISLKEVGSINAPSSNCYICIDVDGPFVAVKDMRPLRNESQEDDDDDNGINLMKICIQRRKFPVDEDNNEDDEEDDEDDTITNYHPPEALPRRQLRILCPSDRICAQTKRIGTCQSDSGLILKYLRRKASNTKCSELQESTRYQITRQAGKEHITSGDVLKRRSQHMERTERKSSTSQVSHKRITHRSPKSTTLGSTVKAAAESSDDEMDDDDTDMTQIFPVPDIDQLGTQSPIMAIFNGTDVETRLVEKESPTESMDQSTQPFSYDGTSRLQHQIVADERIQMSRRSESSNDVDTLVTCTKFTGKTERNIKHGSNEQSNNQLNVSVETEVEPRMEENGSIEETNSDQRCRMHDIDDSDASTALDDDDVARREGNYNNKVFIDKGQKGTDEYTYKQLEVKNKRSESEESELVAVGEISVFSPSEALTDGRLNEMSAKIIHRTTNDKTYSLYSNDGDESSVTTVLSVDEKPDHAVAEQKELFDVENTSNARRDKQSCHDATVIVAGNSIFASNDINVKKKESIGSSTASNRQKKEGQRNYSKVVDSEIKEHINLVSTKIRKRKFSQVALDKPNLWGSPVKPGDTGHHDPIEEDSSASDGHEIQSDCTNLNAGKKNKVELSERNRKVQRPAKDVPSKIQKSKASAQKQRTTTEERKLQQETSLQLTTNALSKPAAAARPEPSKVKITNLSPSRVTTAPISAMSVTQPETQDNTRKITPTLVKRVGTLGTGSGSQNSRKRVRQEGTGCPIRVLITGVDLIPRHKHVCFKLESFCLFFKLYSHKLLQSYTQMIAAIGGELIESVEEARNSTHVIAGDDTSSLRRTPKVMIGICTTSNIVHMDWLTTSAKKRVAQPCRDFLLLNDKKAEMAYAFNMRETLSNGVRMRQKGKSLLNGKSVVICQDVAGNMAPPENELKLIVEAAGGHWINASALGKLEPNQAIIITSNPATKRQLSTKDISKAINHGIQHRSASWLFDCIMKQQLSELEE